MASLVLFAEKLDMVAKCGFLYKIIRRECDVSWDFVCLNAIAMMVPVVMVNYIALPVVLMLFQSSMVVVPILSVVLFPQYAKTHPMPFYCRWPVLVACSALGAVFLGTLFGQSRSYLFHLYTDLTATMPQTYLLLQNPQDGKWSSVGLVTLMALSRIAHAIHYLLHDLQRIFSHPQVMSHLVATIGGLLSMVWWYRKRISTTVCKVIWGVDLV